MAAQILGMMKSKKAFPILVKILRSQENNYIFLRAVIIAISKYDCCKCMEYLMEAINHSSEIVARFATEVIKKIEKGDKFADWDSYTG